MKKSLFRMAVFGGILLVATCADQPSPQIDSVTPGAIDYQSTIVGLKVTGSGFTQKDNPISRVILGGMAAAARVASDHEINATFYPNRRFCGPVTLQLENTFGSIVGTSELVSFYSDRVSFQAPTFAQVSPADIKGVAVGNWNSTVTLEDGSKDTATDMAIVDSTGNIQLFMGTSPGRTTFQAPSTIAAGVTSPSGLVTSDLNQDGIPDLAVVAKDSVSVLYGNGDGTFQGAASVTAAGGVLSGHTFVALSAAPQSALAPQPMLVLASTYLDGATKKTAVSFLIRQSDGTFSVSKREDVLPLGETFQAMAVGDFDRDPNQMADVVFAYLGKKELTFLIAQGDGSYRSRTLALSFEPVMLLAADYNSDGVSDIAAFQKQNVAGKSLATAFRVLLGQGSDLPSVQQRSGKEVDFDAGYTSTGGAIAVGDVNQDRKPDVVSVSFKNPADMNPSTVGFSLSQCPLF